SHPTAQKDDVSSYADWSCSIWRRHCLWSMAFCFCFWRSVGEIRRICALDCLVDLFWICQTSQYSHLNRFVSTSFSFSIYLVNVIHGRCSSCYGVLCVCK